MKWLVRLITFLGGLALICWILITFIITPLGVAGHSMEPTLHTGNRVWTLRLKLSPYIRGHLVVLKAPDKKDTLYVKRVIGVGGDVIKYKDDKLYVNNVKYNEPYLNVNRSKALRHAKRGTYYMQNYVVKIPKGYVYVLGDNRLYSDDSRNYGAVKEGDILGKVVIVPGVKNYTNMLKFK